MRVTVLIENTACRSDLAAEHGLSLYLETGSRRILFDAGQSEAFADNAAALGIDLSAVDTAILSHGHYDHGGGLMRFLQANSHAPVYAHAQAFEPHWHGPEKYIGLSPALAEHPRIIRTGDSFDLGDGLSLCTCNALPRRWAPSFGGLAVERQGQLQPDEFPHEQYLVVQEAGRRIVISGCSHKGAMNILHWLEPDVFIGGFHFVKLPPDGPELSAAAQGLAHRPTRYYTGHCTGEAQFAALKERLGDRLLQLSTGMTFDL